MNNNDYKLPEIVIVSTSSGDNNEIGIYKFENCKFRNTEQIVKNSSCCSSAKVIGYFCRKINKFPVSFSNDCANCQFFDKD